MKLIQSLILFVMYTIPFSFLMLTRSHLKYKKYYVLAKTCNSIAFIAVAVLCAYYGENIETLVYLLPALLLCFIGDIAIGFYNVSKEIVIKRNKLYSVESSTSPKVYGKNTFFIIGLLSFAFGHGCFIYAFSTMESLTWGELIVPLLSIFITIGLTRLEGMNTGKFTIIIVAYSFMVAMLFSKGVHLVLTQFTVPYLLISIGATLFLISDAFILFLYFYKKKSEVVHIINLATYYYGMFFIALSLLYKGVTYIK